MFEVGGEELSVWDWEFGVLGPVFTSSLQLLDELERWVYFLNL